MDPYKILGVEPDATPAEIKSAYRRMATKHHPDRGGDAWIFQQIHDAYGELTGTKIACEPKPKSQTPSAPQQPPLPNDPFGFELPPSSQSNSTFQNPKWQKPKKKPHKTNPVLPWIIGGAVCGITILAGGIGIWFLIGRTPQSEFASVSTEQSTNESNVANQPIPSGTENPISEQREPTTSDDQSKKADYSIADSTEKPTSDLLEEQEPTTSDAVVSSNEKLVTEPETITKTPKPKLEEFTNLLDSELSNFCDDSGNSLPPGWRMQNEVLFFDGKKTGHLYTSRQYTNFELHFEWKLPAGGNSGVLYRVTSNSKHPHNTGPEFQLLDDGFYRQRITTNNGQVLFTISFRLRIPPPGQLGVGIRPD